MNLFSILYLASLPVNFYPLLSGSLDQNKVATIELP